MRLYTIERKKKKMVEEIYILFLVLLLHRLFFPFFSLPTTHTQYIHTRPPGRQVDDAPCRGYFFDRVLFVGAVPSSESSSSSFYIFFKYINVMIQLCALNRQPWYVSGNVFNHIPSKKLLLQLGLMIKLDSFFCTCKFEITFLAQFFFLNKSNTLNAYFHNSFVVSIQVKKNVLKKKRKKKKEKHFGYNYSGMDN